MGRARRAGTSSSSSIESSNNFSCSTKRDLSTDLRLGLSNDSGPSHGWLSAQPVYRQPVMEEEEVEEEEEENECNSSASLFVKVNMEGIPIGRKIDLLALDGYHNLIGTLDYMFNTSILWAEEEGMYNVKTHVLTYEDKEGDWMMVGDVPWEMFLSTVRRLKITRAYNW